MDNRYNPAPNKNYFNGELKSMQIDDRYHTWWISGTLHITSNTNLPNYSYYLDVRSELGEFTNIPLYWIENIHTRLIENNNIAYKIDAYKFNFSFNFAQSSHFSDMLKYREFEFQLWPMLNQKVIQDFEVEATTKDIQALITEINQDQYLKSFVYTNSFDLTTQKNLINLDSSHQLEAYVHIPPKDKPYLEVISFKNLTSEFNLIKAEFRLSCGNKYVDFKIPPFLYRERTVSLCVPLQITLDKNGEFVIDDSIQLQGFFSQVSKNILISGLIEFEYQKLIRTVNINQFFSFDQSAINSNLSKLNFEKNITFNTTFQELENEKIF